MSSSGLLVPTYECWCSWGFHSSRLRCGAISALANPPKVAPAPAPMATRRAPLLGPTLPASVPRRAPVTDPVAKQVSSRLRGRSSSSSCADMLPPDPNLMLFDQVGKPAGDLIDGWAAPG